MNLILKVKIMINRIFLNSHTSEEIHDIKSKYGATTIREEFRAKKMNAEMKRSSIYKMGSQTILRDIDKVLGGAR